jgi:ATP-dependent 26S proteasome regulatory subunit
MAATTAEPESDRQFFADESFRAIFGEYVRAGYQALFIPSVEEARVENELRELAQKSNPPRGYVSWDCIDGFSSPEDARKQQKYLNCVQALRAVVDGADAPVFAGDAFFHFKDLTDFQNDPSLRRILRSLCENNKLVNRKWKRTLVITSPSDKLHDSLKPCLTVVDFNLPTEQMLHRVLEFVKRSVERRDQIGCPEELADEIIAALRGLTSTEAENTLARCLVRHKQFVPELLETIRDEKAQIIRKSEILTYIPEENMAPREEIGGFDLLMSYLDRRCLAYGKQAQAINLDLPKGIVLVGVPGTGKSYVAMAIGRLLNLPAYIMDIGSVFGSLVGESESRMRQVMKQVEAQKGCVLLIDEADKALGGAADAQGDSGTTRRVFGQLLTWLANKRDNTFVIVTLNRTKGIPAEFFRAGRFDAVFYTDLPQDLEREQILKIHLRKRGVSPDTLDMGPKEWAELVKQTENFVGSELEEVVREARYRAFENREVGDPTFEELLQAKADIIPLSTLDKEGVELIRNFCRQRCKPVTSTSQRRRRTTATAGREDRTRDIDIGSE